MIEGSCAGLAGAADGFSDDRGAGEQIRAIHGESADAIAAGFFDQVGAGELPLVRGRVSELVVADDEHERQFLDSGEVQAFVKRAGR